MQTTFDQFLGGQLVIEQPLSGYRAATDPVLLAASIAATSGQSVLDVGCGVGVASLCLAQRVAGLDIAGLELQSDYASLAVKNAQAAQIAIEVLTGDVVTPPASLKSRVFDHVMTNPPYHPAKTSAAQAADKALADRETVPLDKWIKQCLKRVKPKGYFTIIHLADRLPQILTATSQCGEVSVLPIAARADRPAKRVLVRARTNSRAAAQLCAPLIMHEGRAHDGDRASFTDKATAILRHGHPLEF